MGKAVIIYGPQGCGKTTHGKQMARVFGKTEVIEAGDLPADFWKGAAFSDNALVLTSDQALAKHHGEKFGAKVYTFNEAALACGINGRQPYALESHEWTADGHGERVEGVQAGFIAFKRQRQPYMREPMIYVFHANKDGSAPLEDEPAIFMVPATWWTADHINVALGIERDAYLAGERDGRASAQFEIRKALGIG